MSIIKQAGPDYDPANNMVGIMTSIGSNQYNATDGYIFQICAALQKYIYDEVTLVLADEINIWAQFKPGSFLQTDFLAGVYTYQKAQGPYYFIDDFIGYNHNAKPPIYFSDQSPASLSIEEGDLISLYAVLAHGESNPISQSFLGTALISKDRVRVLFAFDGATVEDYTDGNTKTSPMMNGDFGLTRIGQTLGTKQATITPYYWWLNATQNRENEAMCEVGQQIVNVTVSALAATANVSLSGFLATDNPAYVSVGLQVTRTGPQKSVFMRLKVVTLGDGTGVTDMGQVTLPADGIYRPLAQTVVVTSNSSQAQTIKIDCQVSSTYDYATFKSIGSASFSWTPGTIQ